MVVLGRAAHGEGRREDARILGGNGTSALPAAEDLARAARLLAVRTRRAAASLFAGGYASAFRGGGIEFEESRPYVPGDEVRNLDWNATARTGQPFVKRFREERDQTLILLLDVSASMGFGSAGRSKAAVAAHTAALLAAAAGHAGDRVALVAFADGVKREIPPARGDAHIWSIVRALVECAGAPRGGTDLLAGLARVPALARHRAIVVLLSDFRDQALFARGNAPQRPHARLVATARRHDLIAGVMNDPREETLPPVGPFRVTDPEAPDRRLVIDSGSRRVRLLYRAACQVRRRALEMRLRGDGADVLWLRTDRDPLRALVRFFPAHSGRVHGGA
jgi:uncharacterized protein (DUF58 family)